MKIEIIYIPCYKRDVRLTRMCVASIRHWYPHIPIQILKDENMFAFDTAELERTFNVSVYPMEAKVFGMGFAKLEPLFQQKKIRALFLDSDIILAGPIIETLEKYDEDFIIINDPEDEKYLFNYYFNPAQVKEFDPSFHFPGFTFNTGQFVTTCDVLQRSDFDSLIQWTQPRHVIPKHVFPYHGEQPILNYVVLKRFSQGSLSIKRLNYMREGLHPETTAVSIERIMQKEGYPFLIHWHDKKPRVNSPGIKEIPRRDILLHFEKLFYRKAGVGNAQMKLRIWKNYLLDEIFLASVKAKRMIKS